MVNKDYYKKDESVQLCTKHPDSNCEFNSSNDIYGRNIADDAQLFLSYSLFSPYLTFIPVKSYKRSPAGWLYIYLLSTILKFL